MSPPKITLSCPTVVLVAVIALTDASLHHVSWSNHTTPSDQEAIHLGQVKFGLAAAFFLAVLIACGLPIVLVNCVKKSQLQSSHTLPVSPEPIGGPSSCNQPAEPQLNNHHYNAAFVASKHSTEVAPAEISDGCIDWDHPAARVARVSVDSEPLSSPGPMHTETTDLLTGRPVSGMHVVGTGAWPHTRRDRASSAASRRATPDRRGSLLQNGAAGSRRLVSARSSFAKKASLRLWFSRCNCCAAGVFLASGFMELYVDVEESIEQAKTSLNVDTQFPFSPFLTLLGFFLVLSIEQIVWTVRTYRLKSIARAAAAAAARRRSLRPSLADTSCATTPISPTARNTSNSHTRFSFLSEPPTPATRNTVEAFHDDRNNNYLHHYSDPRSTGHGEHSHHHHHFVPVDSLDSFESVLRVAVLLGAMSVHSLFEGLAVGLQTTVTQTLALFSAILLHKIIIAAGIGMNLATVVIPSSPPAIVEDEDDPGWMAAGRSANVEKNLNNASNAATPSSPGVSTSLASPQRRTDRKTMLYQSAFTFTLAVSSPLGVLIGWALVSQNQSPVLLMVTAVLQALACGTFFYVVFCELLPEEFRGHTGDRLGKLAFLIFGFLLVCIYSLLMPH